MLLDTAGLLCYFHRDEAPHTEAVRLFREAPRRVVHNYVLVEFVALCGRRGIDRAGSLSFARLLTGSPHVQLRWVDEALHAEASSLLEARLDKGYSLCDAVSFLVMQEMGITEALTTDHHFEQAGFVRLLRP